MIGILPTGLPQRYHRFLHCPKVADARGLLALWRAMAVIPGLAVHHFAPAGQLLWVST